MQLLVRTPAPHHNESLFGFLLRVSEANGYKDPRLVAEIARFERGQVTTPGMPVAKLAQVLGRQPHELYRISHRGQENGSHGFKILDHDLGNSLQGTLRLDTPAICPACIEESGYIAAFWDLSVSVACPHHRRVVLRSCEKCAEPLRRFRPGLLICNCGAALSGEGSAPIDDVTLELMSWIQAKLYGRPIAAAANIFKFPLEAFAQMPLSSLLQVIEILGSQSLWATAVSVVSEESKISAAAECLQNWPHGYHRFLRAFGERGLEQGALGAGLAKQFEPFYGMMFRNRYLAVDTGLFRAEFVRFGAEQWGHAIVDGKLLRGAEARAGKRFISKSEFASRFGIWKPTMKRLIAAGAVVTSDMRTAQGTRTVIDLHRSQVPEHSSGIVNVRDAAEYLGLPVSVLRVLRERGVFATKHRFGHGSSWHREDVESFLRRAVSHLVARSGSEDRVPLRDAMRLKLRDDSAKADIVAALFDGRLNVVGRVGEDMSGLQLDRTELNRFIMEKRLQVEGESYSLPEVAAKTGLDPSVVPNAIEVGILTAITNDFRTRISAASVERFNSHYVPLATLAKRLGTLSRVLARICVDSGFSVRTLRRRGSPVSQPIMSRDFEPKLLAVWDAQYAPMRAPRTDKASLHEQALRTYLDDLRRTKRQLPREGKNPNKVAIAKACGFHRGVLHSFPTVASILAAFDEAERLQLGWTALSPIEAVHAYVRNLRRAGALLPKGKRGEPNRLAIAKACRFDRNLFYKDIALKALLDRYTAEEASSTHQVGADAIVFRS